MASKEYALTMARYNLWQNENILTAASALSEAERQKDRGAFFGSIERTLSHLFWGDQVWLARFADTPAPDCGIADLTGLIADWGDYCAARAKFDRRILQWAHEVAPDWFAGDLTWYSGASGKELTRPRLTLVIQMFNHQTHHRGQVHAMLTAAGAKPGATDVPFMPEDYQGL